MRVKFRARAAFATGPGSTLKNRHDGQNRPICEEKLTVRPWLSMMFAVCVASGAAFIVRSHAIAEEKDSLGKSLLRSAEIPLRSGPPTPRRSRELSGEVFEGAPPTVAPNQDRLVPQCLMITDLSVVDSPRAVSGPWAFGSLMRSAANHDASGINPEQFVRRWLAHWESDQQLNGRLVRKRNGIAEFINNWPKKTDGDLDLERAPFRLLAIVNRVDLRNNLVLGVPRIGGGGGGEGRFVFGAVDPSGASLNFTVIFEYVIKRRTFEEVQAWGRRWYALKDLPLGSEQYLERLQELTDQFAAPGVDPEQPPNGSALAQLRTNENAFGNVWELREFRLDFHHTGLLRQVTVKQTPDLIWQGSEDLLTFVRENVASPTGTPMLAGSALMQRFFQWRLPEDAPANLESARRTFAFNTCNGCHLAETAAEFTHVSPRESNKQAVLSAFLSEIDLPARAADLRQLVEAGRHYEAKRLPLQFVH